MLYWKEVIYNAEVFTMHTYVGSVMNKTFSFETCASVFSWSVCSCCLCCGCFKCMPLQFYNVIHDGQCNSQCYCTLWQLTVQLFEANLETCHVEFLTYFTGLLSCNSMNYICMFRCNATQFKCCCATMFTAGTKWQTWDTVNLKLKECF